MTGGGVSCGAFLSLLRPCLIHRIILELYAAQVQQHGTDPHARDSLLLSRGLVFPDTRNDHHRITRDLASCSPQFPLSDKVVRRAKGPDAHRIGVAQIHNPLKLLDSCE